MRRVLFIAYLFPPIANSGTRRSLTFANRLPDHGWQPLVLTCEPDPQAQTDLELLHEVRAGTRMERVPLKSRLTATRWFGWLPGSMRARAVEALAWRLKVHDGVPDEVAGWLEPAVQRALALFDDVGFDVVYASGWPWTSFLVAREVARRTGRPYVLDYRDCWITGAEHAWEELTDDQRDRAPALQQQAARDASALITTTQTFAATIRGQLTAPPPFHVVPNGYEDSDFRRLPARVADGQLRIAYTGVWRPGYGLDDLYAAVALLRDWQHPLLQRLVIHAAGFKPGAAHAMGLAPWVTEHGLVPHRRAVEFMASSDVLYLPLPDGFQGRAALAGKHFEYLGSGRPILASAWADSETGRLVREAGGALRVDPGDVEGLAGVLADCLHAVHESRPLLRFPSARQEVVARFTRAATTAQLADVLAQVVARAETVEPR